MILTLLGILVLVIGGISGYAIKLAHDAKKSTDTIYVDVERKTRKVNTAAEEPLSIVLMGIDEGTVTYDLDRTKDYQGRSDSLMYVTLNPKKKQTTIVSLDRDMFVKIVGKKNEDGSQYYSKLNHAYAYGALAGGTKAAGAKMTIETIEDLLDVPADHYITINMAGLEDLIDAIGGIEVDNKYHFELDGVELYPGKQHLNGEQGLAYARYRDYDEETGMGDPAGDVGRQQRQRQVIQLIMDKVLSLNSVSNYQKIFKAIEKNVTTDLTWTELLNVAQGYTEVADNVKEVQLQGQYRWMDGYYQIVPINGLLEIQNTVKEQLELATSDTLPNLAELDEKEYYFDDTHLESDAGERPDIDTSLYFDGNILTPSEDIWTK